MSENYFSYKFLIGSFDYREGKEKEIKNRFEIAFSKIGETDFEFITLPIKKEGHFETVELILKCKKPHVSICEILNYYFAEKIN